MDLEKEMIEEYGEDIWEAISLMAELKEKGVDYEAALRDALRGQVKDPENYRIRKGE
jgi:hypothetical protein